MHGGFYIKLRLKAWHTMHAEDFSILRQADMRSDQWLGRLPVWRALHMRASLHAIAITSDFSPTGQMAIQDRYLFATSRAAVSHKKKHGTEHTHSVTSCIQQWSLHTIPERKFAMNSSSPGNFSTFHYLLRLLSFSASELTLDYTAWLL